ncbi:MAG TPA: hypothetical protein VK648_00830 [Gemmatimonadaceae bacterium]|nr:MAG: hypothetical protein DMF56_19455 [Acidobacteriota bacterium]HTD82314.1 hypothetical protein [Gemmatimonadaceae bacterium]
MSEHDLATVSLPGGRAIETWLESLCTSRGGNGHVLFILDNDFGELTTVMYLVLGQECLGDARILLSPRLYEKNHDTLPGRIALWTSEEDLVQAIETFQPAVVVFASGYLMPVHRLLTAAALERLCELARRHHAVVVTADPFLGLVSQWSGRVEQLISIDIPEHASESLITVKQSADRMLHTALAEAERVLRNVPHLYPSYTDMDGLETAIEDNRNLSFFNDALLLPPEIRAVRSDHWMFVVSEADYATQVMFLGSIEFARIVASLLTQTARLGRDAIFVGPNELVDLVNLTLAGTHERIHLLRYCSFRRFLSLLLSAEYSFYWNVVSHSILMQLWNGRPVILFNRGHLARAVPAIYDRVIAWYYQGWEPPYLDHNAALSLSVLEAAVAGHAQQRDRIMERFRRAPSPSALLSSLRP